MQATSAGHIRYADFRSASFFPSINGIRGLCALIVVKEHADWHLPLPQFFEWGFLGVDMFFVISGFLIVTLLLRERDAKGAIDLRAFYFRRTLRIFPIYYLVIFLIAAAAVLTYPHSTKTWDLYKSSFPVFLLYAQDLVPISLGLMFHTWSLSMEEQFYLVWPTVERFLRPALVVPLIGVLLLVNQACNFGFFGAAIAAAYGNPAEVDRPIFLITFTPILLGVLAAHAMHDPRSGRRIAAAFGHRIMPLVLLLALIGVCQVAGTLQGWPRLTVHLLLCALLLSLVVRPVNVFSGFLNARPIAWLGSISYGLYLYHVFVLAVVNRVAEAGGWNLSPALVFVIVGLLSIGLAALSFRWIERPVMAFGHRRRSPAPLTLVRR